jgi:hypothetical protein
LSAVYSSHFYIQDPDRNSGIKVYGNAAVTQGDAVDVAGTLNNINGERQINLISVAPFAH